MKESAFQAKLKDLLIKRNALVRNFAGSMYTGAGVPDLYVAHSYWSGWLELKIHPNKPTKIQDMELTRLGKRKVNALLVSLLPDKRVLVCVYPDKTEFVCPSIEDFVAKLLRKRA